MSQPYTTLQVILGGLGAFTGLGTLAYSIANMLLAQQRPSGLQTGVARRFLRTPYLVIATILFLGLGYLLWKPLPLQISPKIGLLCSVLGILLLLPSCGLYIWGLRTLGRSFNASSGFGVRLMSGHQLVSEGPFTYIRHPMYLGVILAFWGSLFLYRTWTMLLFAVMMHGLVYRARAEEKALVQAFGEQWEEYRRRTPGWIPRFGRKQKNRQGK